METYRVLGLMSGSSIDGLDIAYVKFEEDGGKWTYQIIKAETAPYPTKWKLRLNNLVMQNAITYLKTHTFFGHYVGELTRKFIEANQLEGQVDFVASHGQTIFHQPDNKVSSQIGDGASIAVVTGVPVVCDFRSSDIALGGQGAPMVPIGEKHLFPDYKFFLNIGGICNISAVMNGRAIGYDVCAGNMALNRLAGELNKEYDEDGNIARSGEVDLDLLKELNGSWYYDKDYPKSLSGGWVSKVMMPTVARSHSRVEDKLRTVVEHIVNQVSRDLEKLAQKESISLQPNDRLLVTGGGALNKFLIERLQEVSPLKVDVPEKMTVDFKEALIIAFAGVLRMREEVNMLSNVTGAQCDNIGGCIYYGGSAQKLELVEDHTQA